MNRTFWSYGGALLAGICALSHIPIARAEGDTIAPAGTMNLPVNHAGIKALTALRGAATDNVGVTKAAIYLIRQSDAKSWNGTAWVTERFALESFVSPPGGTEVQFGRTSGLPLPGTTADNQLTEGNYYLYANIFDAAGHRAATPTTTFSVDRTLPPAPVVTAPAANAFVPKLLPIRGTAVDNEGGSGIDHVAYFLRRLSDNMYWVGGAWVSTLTYTNAVRTSTGLNWSEDGAPPAGDMLPAGKYAIAAYSYDRAGNRSAEPGHCTFTVDKTSPTIAFDSPVPNSIVKSLPILRGPVSDDSRSVKRATVSLRRVSDGLYWDGSKWASALVNLEAVITDNIFRYTSLPSGENLPDGYYSALAYAFDAAGNRSLEPGRCNFRVDSTGPAIAVTEPADNAQVTSLPRVTGTASDAGSGVAHVFVALSRNKIGGGLEYWAKRSGTFSWGDSNGDLVPAVLTAFNATSFAWAATSGLPSGVNLASGQYFAVGVADDKAGNRLVSAPNAFQVTTANVDTVIVTSPANGATITALTAVEGRAVDGQGVDHVLIALLRPSGDTTQIWGKRGDVYGWGSTEGVTLPLATLTTPGATSTNFRLATNLPSGDNFPPGPCSVFALSYDVAGNSLKSAINAFTVGTAAVVDSVAVTSPANGATITGLTAVTGHAVDGQKVDHVLIALLRPSGDTIQVWGRRADVLGWGTTEGLTLPLATLTTTGATATDFHLGANLPSGADLPPGAYSVFAQSFDGAGNALKSATNAFTVAAPTSVYTGKYNVTFNVPVNALQVAGSGAFVLTVDAANHATGSFTVDGLKGIVGDGTFRPDGTTVPTGTVHLDKTSDGDSFAGTYAGKTHATGADPSTDSTLSLTVSTAGVAALHIVYSGGGTADFTGTVNLTTGEFGMSGKNPENKTVFINGHFVRHTGIVTLAGSVGDGGAITATLTNDSDANGDTFEGDLDSLGTAPMRGSGDITDTGLNANGPGDGSVLLDWTSQKQ